MTFISYSQNYEDLMLWRALKGLSNGFYIDVGAAWPNKDSVTKAFYISGWNGINIEPNPELFSELNLHRPRDINLQIAISDFEGELDLNVFSETGLSTLDSKIAEEHHKVHFQSHPEKVKVYKLSQVWDQYVPQSQEVHFLKVDVEGLEERVLKSNDWEKNRPWIVVVEATEPLSQVESYLYWENTLTDVGYLFVYADGLNRFYVDSKYENLIHSFKYPPNIFDDFILESKHQADEKIKELEQNLLKVNGELSAIVNSRSWRSTKPIRLLFNNLRCILGLIGTKK